MATTSPKQSTDPLVRPSPSVESIGTLNDAQPQDVLFSFAAAGWLQMYHFGAAKALQDSGLASMENLTNPENPMGKIRFAGSSAGALASAALVVGTDFDALREYACGCAIDCRSHILGAFNIRHYVQKGVELFATGAFKAATAKVRERRQNVIHAKQQKQRKHHHQTADGVATTTRKRRGSKATAAVENDLGEDSGYDSDNNRNDSDMFDDHEFSAEDGEGHTVDLRVLMRERLEVYATTLPFLGVKKFDRFDVVEDLDEALTASCLLVPLAGLPLRLRETSEWVIDGGAAAFQPRAGERNVVTINTMYMSSADIKPSCFVPIWWGLYPPSDDKYRALFSLGYNDCVDGLLRKRLISPAEFGHLRSKFPDDAAKRVDKRGPLTLLRDLLAFTFFMFILRPFGLLLVYLEMLLVLSCSAAAALLHDVLPNNLTLLALLIGTRTSRRRDGTRKAAWEDVYLAVRNLVSMRIPLRIIVGSRIPVNVRRLERYSRVYRTLRPWLG
jgi:hypothetical protein